MVRPNEVKRYVQILSEPADSVEELAKTLIKTLDELRQDRTDYLVLRKMGSMLDCYGPYVTANAAAKAVEQGKIPALDGAIFRVVPLRTPHAAEEAFRKADEGGMSDEAKKIWQIARNGGQAAPTRRRRRSA